MKESVIKVENVFFSYNGTSVLEDITFTVEHGDFLVIIGPNGSGKTTLLKLFLGLLKPDKGTINLFGQTPPNANHRIGYVPQHTDFNITFPLSVKEVALMGRLSRSRIGKMYSASDILIVDNSLKKVGLWEHRFIPIGNLSGGQRQRVFIARALAAGPEILFLDEPTASVDPEFEVDIYEFLKELNKDVTIVVITHDIGVISRYAKSVACVNHTLVFHGEGHITSEMLKKAYGCPVDLIAHGIPHRVFPPHEGD